MEITNNKIASFSINAIDPELLKITEDLLGKSYVSYLNLKDQAIRDALIKAGWTPPADKTSGAFYLHCVCGWKPKPMAVVRFDEDSNWHCPDCGEVMEKR